MSHDTPNDPPRVESSATKADSASDNTAVTAVEANPAVEIGGPKGPEPTRYGDWEMKGRCIDF